MDKAEAGRLGAIASRGTIAKNKKKRIETYEESPSVCQNCNVSLDYEKRTNKFCGHSCAATYNNPQKSWIVGTKCKECSSPIPGRRVYCGHACRALWKSKYTIQKWLHDPAASSRLSVAVSKHLKKEAGHRCTQCGWGEWNPHTQAVPVEVDHIDGNSTNNQPDNLRVLCPNCHSLTSTYKGANIGSGRTYRRNIRL